MTTLVLFQLAILPQSQRDEIRAEIQQALDEEGGWNKAALAQCRKLDSVLKETGRTRLFSLCKFVMFLADRLIAHIVSCSVSEPQSRPGWHSP
jgi:hypothetical protein